MKTIIYRRKPEAVDYPLLTNILLWISSQTAILFDNRQFLLYYTHAVFIHACVCIYRHMCMLSHTHTTQQTNKQKA